MKVRSISMSFKSQLGLWRMMTNFVRDMPFSTKFGYCQLSFLHQCLNIWLCKLILKVQRKFISFKSELENLRMLEAPYSGLASSSWFWYGCLYLIHQWYKFWLSILILKVQRTYISSKSWFVVFEDAGGSWLEFDIFISIWIWSLVFNTPMFWILALYLVFEGAKNIHVL